MAVILFGAGWAVRSALARQCEAEVRAARVRKGMTFPEVGEALGRPPDYIQARESRWDFGDGATLGVHPDAGGKVAGARWWPPARP